MFKKIILIICLLFTQITPIHAINEYFTPIYDQIVSYGKSIDQSNADEAAAVQLATHGLTGGGKTLTLNKSSALAATLANSKMYIEYMSDSLSNAFTFMDTFHIDQLYTHGAAVWDGADTNRYMFKHYDYETDNPQSYDKKVQYSHVNKYDDSLIWLTGTTNFYTKIVKTSSTETKNTYNVKLEIYDRFDFRGDNGSLFKDFASLLGSALFKEFDWYINLEFHIEVSNNCEHTGYKYYFTYDESDGTYDSNTSGYVKNNTTENEYATRIYYELDKPIKLMHNQPWVLEYTMNVPKTLALCSTSKRDSKYGFYLNHTYHYLFGYYNNGDYDYYGTSNLDYFTYNTKHIYKIHLENHIEENSNMIYVSVYDETDHKQVMEPVPMNDYYVLVGGNWVLKNKEDNTLSGKDFVISMFGNHAYTFIMDEFSLKADEGNLSHYNTSTTKPTCTSNGYTTHTCDMCGYSYKSDTTNKLGHSYGNWKTITEPTCTTTGLKRQTCSVCKTNNEQVIDKLGHNEVIDQAVKSTCTLTGLSAGSHCDRCNEVLVKQNTVPALGHYVITQNVVEPTCSSTGLSEGSYCGRCNEVLVKQETLEQLEHSYTSEVIEPTCTSYGYTHHTCDMCLQEFNDSYVDMLEHTYTNYISDNNATYEADGTKTAKCDNCDSTDTVVDEGTQLKQITITSSTYKVDDQYIYIPLGTNITTLKNNLSNKEHIEVSKVGTGAKINMVVSGAVVDSKEIVISGDTNGDGKITITDMIALKAHILKKNTLEGVYALAGDMNSDSKISITDFIQAKAHILKN